MPRRQGLLINKCSLQLVFSSLDNCQSDDEVKKNTLHRKPKRIPSRKSLKKPSVPPPLPPQPIYDYITTAQFDGDIPNGITLNKDEVVKVRTYLVFCRDGYGYPETG